MEQTAQCITGEACGPEDSFLAELKVILEEEMLGELWENVASLWSRKKISHSHTPPKWVCAGSTAKGAAQSRETPDVGLDDHTAGCSDNVFILSSPAVGLRPGTSEWLWKWNERGDQCGNEFLLDARLSAVGVGAETSWECRAWFPSLPCLSTLSFSLSMVRTQWEMSLSS